MAKVHDVVVRVSCDWDISARDVMDFVDHRLSQHRDPDWGRGRGGVNYSKTQIVGICESTSGQGE